MPIGTVMDRSIFIHIMDDYGNWGAENMTLRVEPDISIPTLLTRDIYILGAVAVVVFLILYSIGILYNKHLNYKRLQNKKNDLRRMKQELQDAYFNQRTLPRKEYYELLEKCNNELEEIEVSMSTLAVDLKKSTPYKVKEAQGKVSKGLGQGLKGVFSRFKSGPVIPLQKSRAKVKFVPPKKTAEKSRARKKKKKK